MHDKLLNRVQIALGQPLHYSSTLLSDHYISLFRILLVHWPPPTCVRFFHHQEYVIANSAELARMRSIL